MKISIKQHGKFTEKRLETEVKHTTLRSFLKSTKNFYATPNAYKTLIVINGKECNEKALDTIVLSDVALISFRENGRKEVAKYGEKGKNGVIFIKTKNIK
ncbi:hypothetical protein [Flavivirga eckloniae]|uniref:TonB-dependent receptor plug domain-containing protein n=1 Tax=Flavivirga eckloniae TaxID=1803846 RepID=A0A2K9PR98_9FLAO|nr:hypothetical protein [Flavivirga eckloniae]AUP79565.1 hypothetical protein C1H87_12945 [Flavivirga eckloniae]